MTQAEGFRFDNRRRFTQAWQRSRTARRRSPRSRTTRPGSGRVGDQVHAPRPPLLTGYTEDQLLQTPAVRNQPVKYHRQRRGGPATCGRWIPARQVSTTRSVHAGHVAIAFAPRAPLRQAPPRPSSAGCARQSDLRPRPRRDRRRRRAAGRGPGRADAPGDGHRCRRQLESSPTSFSGDLGG